MKIPMLRCRLCGKHPPIYEVKSNEDWAVYKIVEKCECGGTFQFVVDDSEKSEEEQK